jgi:hypothetical protein
MLDEVPKVKIKKFGKIEGMPDGSLAINDCSFDILEGFTEDDIDHSDLVVAAIMHVIDSFFKEGDSNEDTST